MTLASRAELEFVASGFLRADGEEHKEGNRSLAQKRSDLQQTQLLRLRDWSCIQ